MSEILTAEQIAQISSALEDGWPTTRRLCGSHEVLRSRLAESEREVRQVEATVVKVAKELFAELSAVRAKLVAAERREKALQEALKQTQWGNCNLIYGKIYHMCPRCDQVEKNGHSPDCPIGLALADTEEPK